MQTDRSARAFATFFLGFALAHGAYQTGRALLHSKQGLDLAPEVAAARLCSEQRGA